MNNNLNTFVSIIIPALNEEIHIKECLESIKNIRYPVCNYEIIVVDNGSTDNTVSICKEFTEYVYVCPYLSIAGLRNYGAKMANGDIYAFIDADCLADEKWLENAIKSLNIETCVTGAYCEIPPDATWIEKTWSLRRPIGRREIQHLGTANLIVPANIFNQIGGFNEKLITGEDYEFCVRAKAISRIILDDSIKVTHLGNPKTIKQFIRREMWHGLGAFGSLSSQLFDKPLIAVICFSLLLMTQIVSLIIFVFTNKYENVLIIAVICTAILLGLTVCHQNRRSNSVKSWFYFFVLFYLYYLSRSISLAYIMLNKGYVRKK